MKAIALALSGLVILAAALGLIQLWFEPFSAAYFMKVLVTLGVIGVVIVLVMLIRAEIVSESKLKKDNFID